ncbi:haloacid dehalogenase type II [Gemmatimonadota bacterium]
MTLDFNRFSYLCFDCYGTLIDWETGLSSSLNSIFRAHGADIAHDDLLESYGSLEAEVEAGPFLSYREVMKSVLCKLGEIHGFEPAAEELEAFPDSIRHWPAFPDSTEALQVLASRYSLVILSNIDDDLFRFSQDVLGIRFDHVFTAQQIGSYKPSRRNFDYLIDQLGVPREEILHVAQSLFHDIAPAGNAGLSTVWVNRRQGLEGSGATPEAEAVPDMEIPDLKSLALMAGAIDG